MSKPIVKSCKGIPNIEKNEFHAVHPTPRTVKSSGMQSGQPEIKNDAPNPSAHELHSFSEFSLLLLSKKIVIVIEMLARMDTRNEKINKENGLTAVPKTMLQSTKNDGKISKK